MTLEMTASSGCAFVARLLAMYCSARTQSAETAPERKQIIVRELLATYQQNEIVQKRLVNSGKSIGIE